MDDLFNSLAVLFPVIGVLEVLTVSFSILFMHYSAKHRNYQLSLGWYICGVLFGFWTLIIFLIKRKDFPGPDLKVCPSCGNRCPLSYEVCNRCLVELPEVNCEEKQKAKKLSKIFGTLLIITFIASMSVGVIAGATMSQSVFDTLTDTSYDYVERISVNGVYYDKNGKCYNDDQNVVLYDEKGRTYSFVVKEVTNEEYGLITYDEQYYVRDDGEKYFAYDCYVTKDGWFYCDKAGLLEYFYPDTEKMTEEELDEYYRLQMKQDGDEYRYYYDYLVDEDGNIYYDASQASWNEKGELITAENDAS